MTIFHYDVDADGVATILWDTQGKSMNVMTLDGWDELEARKADAKGRIVLFDVPFTTYGDTVQYRYGAASAASAHGAVGAMVRSISPRAAVAAASPASTARASSRTVTWSTRSHAASPASSTTTRRSSGRRPWPSSWPARRRCSRPPRATT